MAEIMGMDELPTQLSWGFATREQWGQSALQTKDWLRHLLKLAEENVSHTIILAQEKVFGKREGQDTSAADSDVFSPKVMAWITESTVGWLNPACDYICQTYITTKMLKQSTGVKDPKTGQMRMKLVASDDVEYRLRTRAHEFYLIKFRVPKGNTAPPYIADPSYEKIMSVLQGLDAKIKPQVTGGIKAPLPAKPTPKLTA
jgi:hypothetical protein